MKATTIIPRGTMPPTVLSVDKRPAGTATLCHNLRSHVDATSLYLSPVGQPAPLADTEARPLCSVTNYFTRRQGLLLSQGDQLFFLPDGESVPSLVGTLPGEALCATTVDRSVIIMTTKGSASLDYIGQSPGWKLYDNSRPYPPITIETCPQSFQYCVPRRTLKGVYTHWDGQLIDEDIRAITDDLLTAYHRCCDKAEEEGFYMQPMVARYTFSDPQGNVRFTSAPLVLGTDSGFQCIEAFQPEVLYEEGRYKYIDGYYVTLTGYIVQLTCHKDIRLTSNVGHLLGSRFKLALSPQLHPVDPEALVSYRCLNGDKAYIQLWMPGVKQGGNVAHDRWRQQLLDLTRRIHLAPVCHSRYIRDIYPRCPLKSVNNDFAREARKKIDALLRHPADTAATPATNDTRLAQSIASPHQWVARQVHNTGSVIAWGDILALRYPGHPLPMFSAGMRNVAWHASIAVTFADGSEQAVWSGEGTTQCPDSLRPMLSYPSTDAVEMTIRLTDASGKVFRNTFPLTPCGDMACYMAPQCRPIALTAVDEPFIVPAATSVTREFNGSVVFAKTGTLFTPCATIHAAQGQIMAITQAVKASGNWEFASTRLYLFTSSGIYGLALTDAGRPSSRLISDAPVLQPSQVTASPEGILAVAAGSLLRVSSSHTSLLELQAPFSSIAYNPAFNELWCLSPDGSLSVRSMTTGQWHTRSLRPAAIRRIGRRLLLSMPGQLLDASTEPAPPARASPLSAQCNDTAVAALSSASARASPDDTTLVDILWEARIERPLATRPKMILWHIDSPYIDCTLDLKGDRGGNTPFPTLSLHARGQVNAPIAARFLTTPRRFLTLRLAGRASPDTRFSAVTIT